MSLEVNPPLNHRERRAVWLMLAAAILAIFFFAGLIAQAEQRGSRAAQISNQGRSASHVKR